MFKTDVPTMLQMMYPQNEHGPILSASRKNAQYEMMGKHTEHIRKLLTKRLSTNLNGLCLWRPSLQRTKMATEFKIVPMIAMVEESAWCMVRFQGKSCPAPCTWLSALKSPVIFLLCQWVLFPGQNNLPDFIFTWFLIHTFFHNNAVRISVLCVPE